MKIEKAIDFSEYISCVTQSVSKHVSKHSSAEAV